LKSLFKIVLIIIAILFSLSLLLVLFLPSIIDLTRYKDKVEGFIEDAIQRDVSIREIKVSILKGIGAELSDIKIGKGPELVEIRKMRIRVALLPLIHRKIEMKGISLDDTKVFLRGDGERPRLITICRLHIPLTSFKSDIIEVKGIGADLYNGRLTGELMIDRGKRPTEYSLIHDTKGIEVEPLIKDAIGSKVTISGPLRLEGRLKGKGDNIGMLEGNGFLDIGKGKVKGFEIGEIIRTLGRVTYKHPISLSDYDRISGHYTIGGGYLRTEDLEMVGKDLYLKAKGSYGLINSRLDLLIAGNIIDIPIEIRVGGTISKPIYHVSSPGVGKRVIKELEKRVTKKGDKEIGDLLKGLFKK